MSSIYSRTTSDFTVGEPIGFRHSSRRFTGRRWTVVDQTERVNVCVMLLESHSVKHIWVGVDAALGFFLLQDSMQLICVLCCFHTYEHWDGCAGVLVVHRRVWHAHHHHVVFASSCAGHGRGHHDVQQDVPYEKPETPVSTHASHARWSSVYKIKLQKYWYISKEQHLFEVKSFLTS